MRPSRRRRTRGVSSVHLPEQLRREIAKVDAPVPPDVTTIAFAINMPHIVGIKRGQKRLIVLVEKVRLADRNPEQSQILIGLLRVRENIAVCLLELGGIANSGAEYAEIRELIDVRKPHFE